MVETTPDQRLQRGRHEAGLSQRQLAPRSGVPLPNIAPYEAGRTVPTSETSERLYAVIRVPTLDHVRSAREPLISAARARRLSDIRVFGSVARGQAGAESDVDLLVHPASDASVFDIAAFMSEAEELLHTAVDVVSDRGSGPTMDRILAEAVPL